MWGKGLWFWDQLCRTCGYSESKGVHHQSEAGYKSVLRLINLAFISNAQNYKEGLPASFQQPKDEKKKRNEKTKRFSKQTVCHLGVTQGYPKRPLD